MWYISRRLYMVVYPDCDIPTFMFVFCHHPIFSSLCLRLVDLLLALDYVEIIEVSTGGLYELSSFNVLTIDVAICPDPDK
jgi:hypothetical protein